MRKIRLLTQAEMVENTAQALIQAKHVFDSHGIVFWLDAGTLLGAVREAKILGWDTDADLGMWLHDFPKVREIMPLLKHAGFNTVLNWNRATLSLHSPNNSFYHFHFDMHRQNGQYAWKLLFSKRIWTLKSKVTLWKRLVNLSNLRAYAQPSTREKNKKIVSSIFPVKLRNAISKKAWHKLFVLGCFTPHVFPVHHFDKLETIRFYGETFHIPSDTNAYLTLRYGDWKTPVQTWDYYKDAGERRLDLLPEITRFLGAD